MKNEHGMPPPANTKGGYRILRRVITLKEHQYDIKVPKYEINTNRLFVYVNGLKQICGMDYDEINSNLITFKDCYLPAGSVIEVLVFQ